jgi:hypothetical protein
LPAGEIRPALTSLAHSRQSGDDMANRAKIGFTRRIVPCVFAGLLMLGGTLAAQAQNDHQPRVPQVRQRDRLRHVCGDQA